MWIELRMGKPRKCEQCGTEKAKRYDWANKNGQYKRDLSDWVRLCRSCHIKKDGTNLLTIERNKKRKMIRNKKGQYVLQIM